MRNTQRLHELVLGFFPPFFGAGHIPGPGKDLRKFHRANVVPYHAGHMRTDTAVRALNQAAGSNGSGLV